MLLLLPRRRRLPARRSAGRGAGGWERRPGLRAAVRLLRWEVAMTFTNSGDHRLFDLNTMIFWMLKHECASAR
jgi:hypothetical protein